MEAERRHIVAGLATLSAALSTGEATFAQETRAWSGQAVYTADLVASTTGRTRVWGLDNLDLIGELDLGKLAGRTGAVVHVDLLVNSGGQPNAALSTLEGVDNIEVSRPRARLFEAWAQQDFDEGRGSVRAGLYDLNSEFYATDTSAMLIHPSFGIGTELSATGSGGPSIFPSTALGVRLRWQDHKARYLQAALIDAKAGTLGDPGAIDTRLREGGLAILQIGAGTTRRWSLGVWRYAGGRLETGTPGARGVYSLFEHAISPGASTRRTSLFLRGGVSGHGAPVGASLQLGATTRAVWSGRPDSSVSLGFHAAKPRGPGGSEHGVELAYADKIGPGLTLQPGLQYVAAPGERDIVLFSLRLIAETR